MATKFTMDMNGIMDEWAKENGTDMIDVDQAAEWAVVTGRYHRDPISPEKQCKQDMRKALQQATYKDPQGNKVRTKQPVRGWKEQQTTLWVDVRIGKPDLVHEAFTQNWNGMVNDVKRHAIEKQSYDLNNPYGALLPGFDYNFNQQADEAKMSGEYDDSYNDEEDNNDSD